MREGGGGEGGERGTHSDLSERVHLKGGVLISYVGIVNSFKVPQLKINTHSAIISSHNERGLL